MKTKIILILAVCASINIFSQNITNTLGVSGQFYIKHGTTTLLSVSQTDSIMNVNYSFKIPNTISSRIGIIYKGSERFLHNYGTDNTFLGINSGNFTMTGKSNTSVGVQSFPTNTTGNENSAFGFQSLLSNTTGNSNSAFGHQSLGLNSTGDSNSAFGYQSLRNNVIGGSNSAFGFQSLRFNTASNNSAFGYQSLYNNTTGFYNVAFGIQALTSNTDGDFNVAIGGGALLENVNGSNNTAVGHSSLTNTTGSQNTAIGFVSGNNVLTGTNLTLIGYNAQPTSGSATNQITLGNNQVTSLRCNVTTITSLSDARDKKDIRELSLGLDFISKLKPRQFNWDKREWYKENISDGSKMQETPTAGFIAQELDELQTSENAEWLNLVLKDNPDKWEATPGNILPIMVKGIQELKEENDKLKNELQALKDINEKIVKLEDALKQIQAEKNEIKTAEK